MSGSYDKVMEERQQLVNQIIDNMENGYIVPKAQWNKGNFRIHNPVSGAYYHGANLLKLYMASTALGYDDNRWMTFKQAQSKGYKIKKGEKGVRLEKYIFSKQVEQINEDTGEKETVTIKLTKPIVNTFVVFNGSQIEGIPEQIPLKDVEPSDIWNIADQLIASSECPVFEKQQDRAYYSPREDFITLPDRRVFTSPEAFTSTLIHEMVHSTGHESRLDRPLLNRFGTPDYALEELRAELGAFFMGTDLGIEGSEELLASHTQYLESWIRVLKDDPNELFRACSDSQKAVERLSNNLQRYQEQTMDLQIVKPIKQDLDEYLGQQGLSFPVSDYLLDKMKIPKGETFREKQHRMRDSTKEINDYNLRRESAIKEYREKVSKGEIIPRTREERTLLNAQGHPDNPSVQAARRMLVKHGIMSQEELNQNISAWDAAIDQVMEQVDMQVEDTALEIGG